MYKKAILINEKGQEFAGWTTEELKPVTGELIFNTAMTGFVEILSDPSYINQIITFTSSHVGNYGLSKEDFESNEPKIEGAIGCSFTQNHSSWRAKNSITNWLKDNNVPYASGFDVREITTHLRNEGSSMFALGSESEKKELMTMIKKAKNIIGDNSAISAGRGGDKFTNSSGKIGILDLGAKKSIENVVRNNGYEVIFIKPNISYEKIISLNLDGLIISNGPGDPRSLNEIVKTIEELIGNIPIFGICLGHQLLGLACGLEIEKLPFGHHGSNHPVKVVDLKNAIITSQNHGFAIKKFNKEIKHKRFGEIAEYATNLNDQTNAGLSIWDSMAYSVQFHPEAGPGTNDGLEMFNPFFKMIKEKNAT